jgi:nucleolar protein 4
MEVETVVLNSEQVADGEEKPLNREGRIIIRNIPFDIKENHLKKEFLKFGQIANISVPLKNETNLNRGFAFIEFENKEDAEKAVKTLNGNKYKGRHVEVEFSLPKNKYETKITHIMENTNMTRKDIVLPKSAK